MKKSPAFWLDAARKQSLPQSIIPALLALILAIHQPGFHLVPALIGVLGVAFAHLSMNLFDDWFDWRATGTAIRENLARAGFRARLGKCRYITSGEATPDDLFKVAVGLCGIAIACGGFVMVYRGWQTLLFAGALGFLGIFYSAPPFKLSYRGFGELVIGAVFGPLLMCGVFFAACGSLTPAIILLSISVGLLVANILFVHSIMDFEPDKSVGKMSLAVLIGNTKGMLIVHALFLIIPPLLIVAGVVTGYLHTGYIATLLIAPLSMILFRKMQTFVDKRDDIAPPKWWMGPMENWARISDIGIGWFMIRWYLARNIITLFCVISAVVALISPHPTGVSP